MAVLPCIDELQRRAQSALESSPFYELRELTVQPNGQSLVICGAVTSFYHKQLAQEVVRSVCNDVAVTNSIQVEEELKPSGLGK
jgi:hypothetical protein